MGRIGIKVDALEKILVTRDYFEMAYSESSCENKKLQSYTISMKGVLQASTRKGT